MGLENRMNCTGNATLFAAFALGLGVSQMATASPTSFRASGTVTSITTIEDGAVVSNPSGFVDVGDKYSLTATFNTTNAFLSLAINPSVNIYDLPGTKVSLKLGSYSEAFTPLFDFDSTLQLWNNYNFGLGATDSQSLSFFNYNVSPAVVPFSVGTGLLSESVTFDAFDFSALARSNDLVTSIAPFSSFGSQSFSYDLLNSATGLSVVVQGDVTTAFLTPTSVPEPANWTLMLVGFAVLGLALRHDRYRDEQSSTQ